MGYTGWTKYCRCRALNLYRIYSSHSMAFHTLQVTASQLSIRGFYATKTGVEAD